MRAKSGLRTGYSRRLLSIELIGASNKGSNTGGDKTQRNCFGWTYDLVTRSPEKHRRYSFPSDTDDEKRQTRDSEDERRNSEHNTAHTDAEVLFSRERACTMEVVQSSRMKNSTDTTISNAPSRLSHFIRTM